MIAHCLLCESLIKTYDTPLGVEAVCSSCFDPVEDAGEKATLRGIGEDKRDAVEDLYRVQNEYLEDTTDTLLLANMFVDLEVQLLDEAHRQRKVPVLFEVGPFRDVPAKALELAKWAARKG